MKKFFALLLVLIFANNTVFAFTVDTQGWVDNPENASVIASELNLKSDLKNDYRIYQTTITNISNNTIDVFIPVNKSAPDYINKLLNTGISFKELMTVPKEIAVDSYKEDVGNGNIAKAHKGLICVVATTGAVAAGAGLLGVYPQQKVEEYFSHKKIRKEYNSLKKTIEKCVERIKYILESKNQILEINYKTENDYFLYDDIELSRVLINLISNASEYSKINKKTSR